MSKHHSKPKPDPADVRDRHLHRIELYEKQQREATAGGKSVGIAGRFRGLMLALARQLTRLLPGDSEPAGAAPRASAGKTPGPRAKPHPRRPKPKRRR